MQENNTRILTLVYNGERYLPSLLPLHDEVNTDHGSIPTGPGLGGFNQYDMNITSDDDVDLEPEFIENYQSWLENEVYDKDLPAPLTPYPASRTPISHEEVAREMNKLYIEQLNAEFKPKHPIQVDTLPNHVNSPPMPKKLTPLARYNGDKSGLTYIKSDSNKKEQVDIEDEFISKLMQIEERTVQKWYDQSEFNEEYHYKLMDLLFDEELYYST